MLVLGAAHNLMNEDTIWIGSDHGSYDLKLQIIDYLRSHLIPVHDAGCHSTDIVRYSVGRSPGSVGEGARVGPIR